MFGHARGTAGLDPDCFSWKPPPGWPTGWAAGEIGAPALILYTARVLPMRSHRAWHAVRHQIAGLACDHINLFATLLPLRAPARAPLLRLEENWFDSGTGAFGPPTLTECTAYAAQLAAAFGGQVGCDTSFFELAEGFYPLDPSPAALAILTDALLPGELDELVDWERLPSQGLAPKLIGGLGRWRMALLGANSD